MGLKKWARLLGIVLLVIGILGFIPGITTTDGYLLGIFHVDGLHNIIHIITGLIGLIVSAKSERAQRLFFQIFGWIYLVVTILGFLGSGMVLGLFVANVADNILHLVIAVLSLWLGYSGRKAAMMSAPQM
ncbi:MAG: DUF4383 domain-containing protein [Patescibacteria group bacterium]